MAEADHTTNSPNFSRAAKQTVSHVFSICHETALNCCEQESHGEMRDTNIGVLKAGETTVANPTDDEVICFSNDSGGVQKIIASSSLTSTKDETVPSSGGVVLGNQSEYKNTTTAAGDKTHDAITVEAAILPEITFLTKEEDEGPQESAVNKNDSFDVLANSKDDTIEDPIPAVEHVLREKMFSGSPTGTSYADKLNKLHEAHRNHQIQSNPNSPPDTVFGAISRQQQNHQQKQQRGFNLSPARQQVQQQREEYILLCAQEFFGSLHTAADYLELDITPARTGTDADRFYRKTKFPNGVHFNDYWCDDYGPLGELQNLHDKTIGNKFDVAASSPLMSSSPQSKAAAIYYHGFWLNHERHGLGFQKFPDGASYCGEFVNNAAHGKGTFHFADGDVYVGEFRNNHCHGTGKYVHFEYGNETSKMTEFSKNMYLGEWKNDVQDGLGIEIWKNYELTGSAPMQLWEAHPPSRSRHRRRLFSSTLRSYCEN